MVASSDRLWQPKPMLTYEYLVVYHLTSTKGAHRPDQTWTTAYQLWRPGATEAEERPGELPLTAILNDLGREGWGLASSEVLDSVVAGPNHGWPESGMPVRQRWTFIREGGS